MHEELVSDQKFPAVQPVVHTAEAGLARSATLAPNATHKYSQPQLLVFKREGIADRRFCMRDDRRRPQSGGSKNTASSDVFREK